MTVKSKRFLFVVLTIALCIALCSCGSTKYEYEDIGISQAELEKITKEAKKEILAEQFFWPLTKSEAAAFIGSNQPYMECYVDAVRGTLYIKYESGAGNWSTAGLSPILYPNGTCTYYWGDIEAISSFKQALDERVADKIKQRQK